VRENSEKCLICGKNGFKNANGFTKHLRVHKISTENYYLFYINHNAGICEVCGKEVKFSSIDKGFPKLCKTCNNKKNPKRIQKIKETNLKKYGVENVSQVESFKENRKQTNLRKYGVEYTHQNKDIMKKCLNTWDHKYEGGHPGRDPKIKQKKKNTCQKRYGVDNPSSVQEFKEKRRKTNLEIYGESHPMKTKKIRKQFEEKMIQKYGVKNALQYPTFLEKARQTNQKNRGTDWPMQHQEVIEKVSGENSYRWIEDREHRYAPYTELFFNEDFRKRVIIEQGDLDPLSGDLLEKSAHLHHIDYDKTNDSRENLIFLNQSNHLKTNTNREHWSKLLSKINQLYVT